jgi:toxin YoeB
MRRVAFHADACADFTHWAKEDPKLFERLTRLISETAREPFGGIGKPEPLRHNLKGCWSRRISDEHRLVYKVTEDSIVIISCRYHY